MMKVAPRCLTLVMCVMAANAVAEIGGVVSVEKIARLTGPEGSDSINPTWEVGIGGADLGHMITHKGRTYFVFGDSFSSDLSHRGKPGTGEGWRWNSIAYTTDSRPRDGITFDGWITDAKGRAREIVRDTRNNPITNIPTGGISVGDKIIVWYMAMKFWGDASDPCWQSHFAGLAWSDDGKTFHIQDDFRFAGTSNFGMVAAAKGDDDPKLHDGYIYIWGTPSNRCGGVKLARVQPDEITSCSAYRYYGGLREGRPTWVETELDAPLIVPPPAGEMSVMYNAWADVWMMMYFKFREEPIRIGSIGDIVLRQAPKPWGPWSEPLTVVTAEDYPALYGSYMNPRYVENNGESVYFTMSLWNLYDVYWMKATFTKNMPASTPIYTPVSDHEPNRD
jgi:hypothetical protein